MIGNALQYCQRQTASVKVELELVKRDRSPQLQVKVRDTGIGIPAEALPHIFDRFYRVTPYSSNSHTNFAVKGSGLGLAIASAIVENHRGQISAESVVDRGTTFTVVLPVASEGS